MKKGCWSCSWIIQKTTGEFKRDFGKKNGPTLLSTSICSTELVNLLIRESPPRNPSPLSFLWHFLPRPLVGKTTFQKKRGGEKRQQNVGLPLFDVNFIEQIIGTDFNIEFALDYSRFWAGFSFQTFKKAQIPKGKMDQMGRKLEITTNRTVFSQRIELQPVARYVWGFEIVQYHIILRSSRVHWAIGALRRSSSPCPFSTPCHKTKKKSYITLRFFSSTQDNQGS